jgi:hypothetical protein
VSELLQYHGILFKIRMKTSRDTRSYERTAPSDSCGLVASIILRDTRQFSATRTSVVQPVSGFNVALTFCMPYKNLPYRNVAGCGSTSGFNRSMSLGVALHCSPFAPRFAPLAGFWCAAPAVDLAQSRCIEFLVVFSLSASASVQVSSGVIPLVLRGIVGPGDASSTGTPPDLFREADVAGDRPIPRWDLVRATRR